MIETFLIFLGLSSVVLCCGVVLARSAERLGREFSLGGSLAGYLLLAGATSLPELVVSVEAARLGDADLAFGDLLGSCLFNLMILGLLDLFSRSRERMLSVRSAAHALSALVTIFLAAIVGGGVLLELDLPLPAWWPSTLSITSLFIVPAYIITSRVVLLDMSIAHADAEQPNVRPNNRRWTAVASYAAAAAVLFLVGPKTAEVAIKFADQSGLGGTFVGTTFVAAVTSLPEVVTTYAALRLGAPNLAIGNILGSNAFNLVMTALVDIASAGRLFASVTSVHAISAFAVILATAVASMGLLYRAERQFGWVEPDAAAVLALSLGGFVLVYFLS